MKRISFNSYTLLFIMTLTTIISCKKEGNCDLGGDAIILTEPAAISNDMAVISCDILLVPCDAEIVERGVCYDLSPIPDLYDDKETKGSGPGSFVVTLSELQSATTYYVNSYIIVKDGTVYYGSETIFSTL